MYNIRIKQLPKNGDQRNYSLVDRNDLYIKVNPINQDSNVKNTISAVPREEANIEAEGGETVIGDINNDGFLEHSKIVGKRHTKGGVPLNVAPGSFIFSDTKKLKIKDPEVLSIFGITNFDKSGVTPAKIAQKYPMNNYMNILKDDATDPISKRSASQMLKNNLEKLGMLALVQESMKGFPDGVPAIAQSVMAGLQGQQSPGQEQGEGVENEVMEGREAAGEEGQMRYGGMAMYQKAGAVKQKPKPAPGTFYINGKPNLITQKYNGFFGDEWVKFKTPITVLDEDGNPDTMDEMTVEDWNKLTKNKSLKMGYEDNAIAPSHYTDVSNLTWWNQDRSIGDIGRGVKYNTLNYSTAPVAATPKPTVKPQMTPGYTFNQGNKKYKVIAPDVYSPYGTENGNRQAVSVQQLEDPDQNFSSFFDTKFGQKLIPIDEYNKIVGITPTVNPAANTGNTQQDAAATDAKDWAADAEEIEEETPPTTVVIKEDNSSPAPQTVVTSNTKQQVLNNSNNTTKKVQGKIQTFPKFIIPSGKFKGQEGSAVKMGDTIRIFYPDGTHEAFLNGKPIPGYRHGGSLPKHQGLDGPSTVGDSSSGSMMDDGSSSGGFFDNLFGGKDESTSDSATPSLDQQAIDATANTGATSEAATIDIQPVATNTTAGPVVAPELPSEISTLFPPDAVPTVASQPALAATAQGIQNGSVAAIPTGDPNKKVIANNDPNYEFEPSSINKLPSTSQENSTYEDFKPANYQTKWIPKAQEAMLNPEGAKAIDDYLTNVASKGKYGPNILARLEGLTGQARYDKILQLATDGKPGPFHNAFLEAITPKKPGGGGDPEKKRAWACKEDATTGEREIYQFEYEGEMPAGSYATRAEAEVGCNKKPDDIPGDIPERPKRKWWLQDNVGFAGAMTDTVNYYPPALSQVDLETPRYALGDPDRRIAAMQEVAAADREAAYNTTAGNVAGASQVAPSNQRLGQAANIIGAVENENTNIFNKFSGNISEINNKEKILNANALQNYIGQSATARQQYDNAKRALKWRQLGAFNNGTTNFQRTNQLSDMFNYDFDRNTGDVTFKGGRQMYDAQGRPVYDTYVNPANPNDTKSSGPTYQERFDYWVNIRHLSPEDAARNANAEINGKAATSETSNTAAGRNAIITGQALPKPLPSKYGGKVKKQYGGVVFDFGALPLYFFED